ncbi:MAG: hypothetical protein LBB55_04905 [Zoogloeaceae bacterium]|jgi:hypothetical protein|nr:hypothetical protein [Zoogloeaceae bacterium]
MNSSIAVKVFFYFVVIIYHYLLLFTHAGNYFHGGTVVEAIALKTMGVLLLWMAFSLRRKTGLVEKIFVILCSILPVVYVVGSLIWGLKRLF